MRTLGGITQSELIRSLMEFFENDTNPSTEPFRAGMVNSFTDSDVLAPVLTLLYGNDEAKDMLRRWWNESVMPLVPAHARFIMDTVFEYDLLTLPAYTIPGRDPSPRYANETLPEVEIDGDGHYLWRDAWRGFDVPAFTLALVREEPYEQLLTDTVSSIYYKVGANNFLPSTNHEEIIYYMGRLERQLVRP